MASKPKVTRFIFSVLILFSAFQSCFLKKRVPPSAVFYTLDTLMLDYIVEVRRCLNELRFNSFFNAQSILFQKVLSKKSLSLHKDVTYDISIRLITRHFLRKDIIEFLRVIFKRLRSDACSSLTSFRELKYEVLDRCVFEFINLKYNWKIDLITTNSNLFRLPMAFQVSHKSSRVMLWYSVNNIPINEQRDTKAVAWPVKNNQDFIDVNLVWTITDKEWLLNLGISNALEVGSILFRDRSLLERDENHYVLTFFDVTPVGNETDFGRELYSKYGQIYLSEINLLMNLREFFKVVEQVSNIYPNFFKVRIKVKRSYAIFHSKVYISELERKASELRIELIQHSHNLYKLVSESDLVVGVPFTSPVVLANELKRDCLFFSVHANQWEITDYSSHIPVIGSSIQFYEMLSEKVKKKYTEITVRS